MGCNAKQDGKFFLLGVYNLPELLIIIPGFAVCVL